MKSHPQITQITQMGSKNKAVAGRDADLNFTFPISLKVKFA